MKNLGFVVYFSHYNFFDVPKMFLFEDQAAIGASKASLKILVSDPCGLLYYWCDRSGGMEESRDMVGLSVEGVKQCLFFVFAK